MGKRPETAPMVRCPDVAHILNKFAEPIFWCKPERRFRKNTTGRVLTPSQYDQCELGFDPFTDYVWMPYVNPSGVLLHLAYVDCYYVGDEVGDWASLYTYVPDDTFQQYIVDEGWDSGIVEDWVLTAGISGQTIVNVLNKGIADLTGIEAFVSLTNLNCGNNNLTTLDISNNTNLTSLHCYQNQITSLDVSQNTALTYLYCGNNSLFNSNLDISSLTALETLWCLNMNLTDLTITGNTALTFLNCSNNDLTCLNLKNGNNTSMTLDATTNLLSCITVDDPVWATANWTAPGEIDTGVVFSTSICPACTTGYTYVPDNNFELALISLGYDTLPVDNYVLTANISGVTSLDVSSKSIADLTGIEDFVSLIDLECQINNLSGLTMSENTALTTLKCFTNQLTYLDISGNTSLDYLNCGSNQFTSLSVSNTTLTSLYCNDNLLTLLDVSGATALDLLYCDYNQLTSIDLSQNTALVDLSVTVNDLTSIDVSSASGSLNVFGCFDNDLTTLDVNSNINLTNLYCNDNDLTSLYVSGATALQTLNCKDNQLSSLDVNNNTSLTSLDCHDNQLTSLNVTGTTVLEYCICYDNLLTCLNVQNGNNTAMTTGKFQGAGNSLTCITVDNVAFSTTNWTAPTYIDVGVVFSATTCPGC